MRANRGGGRSTQEESGRKQAHQGWKSHANHEWKPLEEVGERIESQRRALDESAFPSGLVLSARLRAWDSVREEQIGCGQR